MKQTLAIELKGFLCGYWYEVQNISPLETDISLYLIQLLGFLVAIVCVLILVWGSKHFPIQ